MVQTSFADKVLQAGFALKTAQVGPRSRRLTRMIALAAPIAINERWLGLLRENSGFRK